ncbi:MAG: UvrD-helicase domain-containing protein [Polaromonas sp.]|nr:UvrD-helicase domain-containing protein [Polaromonas sp.]
MLHDDDFYAPIPFDDDPAPAPSGGFEAPSPPVEAYEDELARYLAETDPEANGDQRGARETEDAQKAEAERAFQEREAARQRERESLFARLNPRQQEAVNAPAESLLVLAGAGSGKTSVLTARIAQLVTTGVALPRNIMAVTFTNKAAQEMRHRLGQLLDRRSVQDLWVGTFHSLCNKMLRENYAAAGLPKSFAILDTDMQESLCRSILKDFGLTKSSQRDAAKRRALSDVFAEGGVGAKPADGDSSDADDASEFVKPGACVKYINARKEEGAAPMPLGNSLTVYSTEVEQMEAVYAEYESRCKATGLLDFQDLLSRGVELLTKDADVRNAYRDRFTAILVDEFQDTNDIQYRWLKLLKGDRSHVLAVGDDSQSIYSFRGANPENMHRFVAEMTVNKAKPDGFIIKLEQNYRSLPHILEVANAVIDRNPKQLKKTLFTSQVDRGDRVDVVTYDNGYLEASAVAEQVFELIKHKKKPASEIALLYRTNSQSRLLEQELNKRGVPATVYGGFRFYDRQEIKNVLAYLDLVADVTHDLSFVRVANFPPRDLGDRSIEELRQSAQAKRISMMEMVGERSALLASNPKSLGNLTSQKKQRKLEEFANLIMDLAEFAAEKPLSELMVRLLDRAGISNFYLEDASSTKSDSKTGQEAEDRLSNIGELISAAKQFEEDHPDLLTAVDQLPEYLAHVALMSSTSEADMSKKQTVSLMTVHASKGLEFDHVFLSGMEDGNFPHQRSLEGASELSLDDELRAMGATSGDDGTELVSPDSEPSAAPDPGSDELQEERRLLYVAITRARKTLTVTHANERLVNGQTKFMLPSRFLTELPEHRVRRMLDPRAVAEKDKRAEDENQSVSFQAAQARSQQVAAAPAAGNSQQKVLGGVWRPRFSHGQPGATTKATEPATPSRPPAPQPAIPRDQHEPASVGAEDVRSETYSGPSRRVAVIGTAGRDKSRHFDRPLWDQMVEDLRRRVGSKDVLVSGGAAWADHLAVRMFLDGAVAGLRLYLPSPFDTRSKRFEAPAGSGPSSGSVSNYYHERFQALTGIDSRSEIAQAIALGAISSAQPLQSGFGGLFARNAQIAQDSAVLLAYTWFAGDAPDPSSTGTRNTWDQFKGQRAHVSLDALVPGMKRPLGASQNTDASVEVSAVPKSALAMIAEARRRTARP